MGGGWGNHPLHKNHNNLKRKRSTGGKIMLPRYKPLKGELWRRKWQPTPVVLLGEPHGQRSLEGCSPWGHKESDTAGWQPGALGSRPGTAEWGSPVYDGGLCTLKSSVWCSFSGRLVTGRKQLGAPGYGLKDNSSSCLFGSITAR